jgi:hypothetical protein
MERRDSRDDLIPVYVVTSEETTVKRFGKALVLVGSGAMLLQFGGCVAGALADVFFAVGPLLL